MFDILAAAGAGAAPPGWLNWLPIIGMVVIFWFLIIRPQMKRQKEHQEKVAGLKKGDQVAALLIAANHDTARFETPEKLIPNRRPNAHLGFGHGPHVCLGMQLARAEAQVAIARLFSRFPNIALANPDAPPDYARRIGIHGLKRLELKLN